MNLHLTLRYPHHYRALDALLEKLAAGLIYAADGTGGMVSVGSAAAGAEKLRPAVLAFRA